MKLLTSKQVMEITGLKSTATNQMMRSEDFPLIVLGKRALRVDEQDLYEYLRKKKINCK
ncbi:MAG: AlpA family phage regulatory protein [Clostridiales bacterium]|uniref:helix-turn-helix transcriptional regulator n=1 Tax=Clostridium sp. TaxID=1506 RepID=UPI00290997F5|nr:AlpA family phage regulatory protein [Clostridium sp.]MDU6274046.1 AlpA family phage regulatory protein [Clostridium sp.]MDU6360847.1 AlpA family phage regulatory protein [Clostridiales bacterium]